MNKEDVKERLLDRRRIDENGCWLFIGSTSSDGYGQLSVNYKLMVAHRLSAFIFLDFDLDSDEQVLHKPFICKSRRCFNPEHLYIGNHGNNMRDKSVTITHCPNGHEYTQENTYRGVNGKYCKRCNKIAAVNYRAKRKSLKSRNIR